MDKIDVAVLLRCRYREWQLKQCLDNVRRLFEPVNISYHIFLISDRPTEGVSRIARDYYSTDLRIDEIEIRDGCDGHRWARTGMDGLNIALEEMDRQGFSPQWLWFHDDDEIFPDYTGPALKRCLNETDILAWVATSLFLWDAPNIVNFNIFHYSPVFCRYRKGDRFNTIGHSVQVTDPIHKRIFRNPFRKKTLPFYLKDLSVMVPEDREGVIQRFKQAEKDDGYTRSFSETPCLMSYIDVIDKYTPIDFAEMQIRRRGILKE